MTTVDELVWTRKEAAARLKLSLRLLDQLRAAGELPSFTVGDRRLFRESDLREFVDNRPEVTR